MRVAAPPLPLPPKLAPDRAAQPPAHIRAGPSLPAMTPVPAPAPVILPVSLLPVLPVPAPPLPGQPLPPPGNPLQAAEPASAFRLAEAGYARQAAGQRRQAAALFDAALALEPGHPGWAAEWAMLGRRWQIGGFAVLRDGGPAGPAASPVLGGGQLGASLVFLPDPLAQRPLALLLRANIAASPRAVDAASAQLAAGLRWQLRPGLTLAAERLIPLGAATRADWTVRLAAGGAAGRLAAYGEAGVLAQGGLYAGAQASARLLRIGPAALAAGSWASLQTGTPDVWRVDLGPSLSASMKGVRLQADWRQRVGGNAAPGSGPVVTLSSGF